MNNLLDQDKILIAGAGGLLGIRVVIAALEQGAQVVATDINIEVLTQVLLKNDICIDNDKLSIFQLDITNESEVKSFFCNQSGLTGAVNSTYPRNNTYGAHFFDVTLESFNDNVALHLGSAFLFTQQCAAYFNANKNKFSLVNISSIYGVIAPRFEIYENTAMTMPVEYAAIKSALLNLNKYVSAYVSDSRFRINSVSPGGIFDDQPIEFLKAYKINTHGTGMLDVNDILGSIMFLLSDQSKFVVGQNIIVDDGFSLS
jgi:NAD(P)-dependent dehydrogenase (short-subunit alcohol dehydrogenase family)